MFEIRNGLNVLIFIYILSCLTIWYIKPAFMFSGSNMKAFGIGNGKTIFNFYIVNIFIALLLFYIFEIISLKKNNFL